MADTSIEWATKVWNVTRGCRRISPGCGGPNNEGGCYAERQAMRMSNPGGAYEGLVHLTPRGPRWTGKGRFATDKLDEPLRWSAPRDGSRHRVFVDSMSDLFFEAFSNEQIAAVFGVMAAAPQHGFLVLTKRADRMRAWFRWMAEVDQVRDGINAAVTEMFGVPELNRFLLGGEELADDEPSKWDHLIDDPPDWPLSNVWLGVSVESDGYRGRIDDLRATPAAVRFLSLEPLLEPLPVLDLRAIDWVIVGGESGPGARPMDLEWVRDIRDQCRRAGVACFVKQLGAAWARENGADRKGADMAFWPEDLRIQHWPGAREVQAL